MGGPFRGILPGGRLAALGCLARLSYRKKPEFARGNSDFRREIQAFAISPAGRRAASAAVRPNTVTHRAREVKKA